MSDDKVVQKIERIVEQKIIEFDLVKNELTKLSERAERHSTDLVNIRQTITDNAKTHLDGIQRIHYRLDVDMKEAREARKEIDKNYSTQAEKEEAYIKKIIEKADATDKELQKFKNIGYGIMISIGVAFTLAQYIVVSTVNDLRETIGILKQFDAKIEQTLHQNADKNGKRISDLENMLINDRRDTK